MFFFGNVVVQYLQKPWQFNSVQFKPSSLGCLSLIYIYLGPVGVDSGSKKSWKEGEREGGKGIKFQNESLLRFILSHLNG